MPWSLQRLRCHKQRQVRRGVDDYSPGPQGASDALGDLRSESRPLTVHVVVSLERENSERLDDFIGPLRSRPRRRPPGT